MAHDHHAGHTKCLHSKRGIPSPWVSSICVHWPGAVRFPGATVTRVNQQRDEMSALRNMTFSALALYNAVTEAPVQPQQPPIQALRGVWGSGTVGACGTTIRLWRPFCHGAHWILLRHKVSIILHRARRAKVCRRLSFALVDGPAGVPCFSRTIASIFSLRRFPGWEHSDKPTVGRFLLYLQAIPSPRLAPGNVPLSSSSVD